jgi:hypothetical protein
MSKTYTKDADKLSIPAKKPRAKFINDVLVSRKGGKMRSSADFDRQQLKHMAELHEFDDEESND